MNTDENIAENEADEGAKDEKSKTATDQRGRFWYSLMAALLLLGPLVLLAFSRLAAPVFERVTDEETLSRARSALILVSADWCGLCRRMERELMRDPSFRAEAGGLHLLRVDWSDPDSSLARFAAARFDVKGVPTMILLDGAGHVAAKWHGMTEVHKILAAMKQDTGGEHPAKTEN